jgi:hypothetical protein
MSELSISPEKEKTPFHTRFGLRLLQVLLIVFALLLLKRCVDIYRDNKLTNEPLKIEFFDKGFANGMRKAKGLPVDQEPEFANYALKKAYRDGYRQGWDQERDKEKKP